MKSLENILLVALSLAGLKLALWIGDPVYKIIHEKLRSKWPAHSNWKLALVFLAGAFLFILLLALAPVITSVILLAGGVIIGFAGLYLRFNTSAKKQKN